MEQADLAPNFTLRETPRGGPEDVLIYSATFDRKPEGRVQFASAPDTLAAGAPAITQELQRPHSEGGEGAGH